MNGLLVFIDMKEKKPFFEKKKNQNGQLKKISFSSSANSHFFYEKGLLELIFFFCTRDSFFKFLKKEFIPTLMHTILTNNCLISIKLDYCFMNMQSEWFGFKYVGGLLGESRGDDISITDFRNT